MCEARPGPRCNDKCDVLFAKQAALEIVKSKQTEDSHEYFIASEEVRLAQEIYDTTPRGIAELAELYEANPEDESIKSRYLKGKLTRELQTEAIKEIRNGRYASVGLINSVLDELYDEAEVGSLVEASREYYEKFALKNPTKNIEPNEEVYTKYLDGIKAQLIAKYGDEESIPADVAKAYQKLEELPAPNMVSLNAYNYMPKAMERSKSALNFEIRKIAGLHNISKKDAQLYYEAYREQYKNEFANLPATERPDPPSNWIRGEFSSSGYTQDSSSFFAPRDPASLYAIYRLRSDSESVPDHLKTNRVIASIDLETSGPEGKEGFEPENGRIIEVGIVNYASNGKRISVFEELIKPEKEFLEKHGTGAEHVHQISVEMLKDAPSWKQVEQKIEKELAGKTLLAQNAAFEYKWLKHHMNNFNNDGEIAIVDTLDIARKHFDLPNHKLKTICGEVGQPYTNGHRAFHDAEVAAEAFFKMQAKIKKAWNSKPARKNAPLATPTSNRTRWDNWEKPVK